MHMLRNAGLLLAGLLLSGCVESTMQIALNRDGSGTITVREFYSPQIAQAIAGMGMEGDPAKDFMGEIITRRAAQWGEGVALAEQERLANARGWSGYRAQYRFEDIRQLRLALTGGPMDAGAPAEGETIRFTYEPGPSARLGIRLPDAPDEGDEKAMGGDEPMDDAMMQMMRPMLQGMRVVIELRVDDPIAETNARYLGEDRRTVTLLDVAMDRVLDNPAAMRLLQSQAPDAQARLAEMGLEGVRIEAPGRTVEVRY